MVVGQEGTGPPGDPGDTVNATDTRHAKIQANIDEARALINTVTSNLAVANAHLAFIADHPHNLTNYRRKNRVQDLIDANRSHGVRISSLQTQNAYLLLEGI